MPKYEVFLELTFFEEKTQIVAAAIFFNDT